MIPTFKKTYRDGELRIGWASWDEGSYTSRSIKYAYPDASGKISRGSPELPFNVLVDMTITALEEGEIPEDDVERLQRALGADAALRLRRERIRRQSKAVGEYVATAPEAAVFYEEWGTPRRDGA